MPYPNLRPDERRDATPGQSPGVLVVCRGRRYFFPGGELRLGMILAEQALGRADLDDPGTRIEWGHAAGTTWVCETKIKIPTDVTPATVVASTVPAPGTVDWGWG